MSWTGRVIGGVMLGAVLVGAPWLPAVPQPEAAIHRYQDVEGILWFSNEPTPPVPRATPPPVDPGGLGRHDLQALALLLGVIVALPVLYFLPALIARRRQNRQWRAITVLNLLLGWTFYDPARRRCGGSVRSRCSRTWVTTCPSTAIAGWWWAAKVAQAIAPCGRNGRD